ncbi:palmitoyltransferase ZDHHC17-like [Tetranychus urticae]|uniref:palmitoyltransferase ZDHHC17-like n=1 Tax=Tetranychus urticae TaxID=32264 RepID=UPI00077BA3C4|nr:palmitoyltransferase ZDHHC17-like [Tetranychus urticae]
MVTKGDNKSLIPRIDWQNLVFERITSGDLLNWIEEYGSDILFQFDSKGYAPIHWVSKFGLHDITTTLLENGVSASTPADVVCGAQPIHIASMEGHTEVIDVLLSYGADVNARDKYKCTPLMRAVMTGSHHVRNSRTILHLLCRGADPYLFDGNKFSVLHYATLKEDLEAVNLFLNIGVNPNLRSQIGVKSLHIAYYTGNYQIVKRLVIASSVSPYAIYSLHQRQFRANKSIKSLLADIYNYGASFFMVIWFLSILVFMYPAYVYDLVPNSMEYVKLHVVLLASSGLDWVLWYATWATRSYVQPNSLEYKKVLEAKLVSASKLKEEIKKISESKSKERIKLPGIPYFSVKLCHTCKIIQEIGTKHCSYCNRCIANHDHHCIYLNNCISSYNRILFIALTFSLAVTGSSLIIILYISLQKTNYKVNWRQFGLFLLALNLCFNGGLMLVHSIIKLFKNLVI